MNPADLLLDLRAPFVLLLAGAVLVLESGVLIGLFLPGASTVLVLGLVADLGVIPLPAALALAFAATALGAQLGYQLGRRRGLGVAGGVARRGLARAGVGGARERLTRLLDRGGAPTIIGAHCVALARTLAPRLAGTSGVAWRRFSGANLVGCALWSWTLVLVGHSAGAAFDQVRAAVGLLGAPLLVVGALVVAVVLLLRRRARRMGGAGGAGEWVELAEGPGAPAPRSGAPGPSPLSGPD
ncbi:DedA family protein [Actinoalloteichus caeruleus]|uniref:DedA family protein n=1 Tax=Actinoalloteichus cyanogriseus TaxID=2893586 RepID=UPI00068B9A54|nr:VTT domain-containing protein [Actinoalloteichus caeruleus]